MKVSRRKTFFAAIVIVAPIVLEIATRTSGLMDFPLYRVDNVVGYIPKPNQSGAFLGTNDWAFNEHSMGTARPFRTRARERDILLIGDSIVLGGNPYKQKDRLGPQLEEISGATVWPISAGSWGLQNELAYLLRYPHVISAVDEIVFVLNSADFGQPSSWASELTRPRSVPTSAALYVLRKYGLASAWEAAPKTELQVPKRNWTADFRAIFGQNEKPITIILYPNKDEQAHSERAEADLNFRRAELLALDPDVRAVVTVSNDERWNTGMYRDGIHPSVQGTALLARIIAEQLRVHVEL